MDEYTSKIITVLLQKQNKNKLIDIDFLQAELGIKELAIRKKIVRLILDNRNAFDIELEIEGNEEELVAEMKKSPYQVRKKRSLSAIKSNNSADKQFFINFGNKSEINNDINNNNNNNNNNTNNNTVIASPRSPTSRFAVVNVKKVMIDWTRDDVGEWLKEMNLGKYIESFRRANVRGVDLGLMDHSQLVQLGVLPLGHRKQILREISDNI